MLPAIFNSFSPELRNEMQQKGIFKTIPKGIEIVHEGQYIQFVPLVLNGLVKVITRYDDREFLLYYIQPNESCIMSFFGAINETNSQVIALTEAETDFLLLPSDVVRTWLSKYPEFNLFFHQLNNTRYLDLLHTLHKVLFENLDNRVYSFLQEKSRQNNDPFVRIRHREIADAMGTTREVISRVTKKLEQEKKIEQQTDGILVRL